MKAWFDKNINKLFIALLAFRLGVLAVGSFLSLSFPDVWRQVVTLGVSMRYWSRWTAEAGAAHLLLPAVLDSADTQGIMPMEFPLLNWITAPWFALGPHLGRGFATLFYNLIMFTLVGVNARVWKGKKIAAIDAYPAMLILPIFSIGLQWSGKFMPDFLSILLVCIATGLSWEEDRPLLSGLTATIGMLLKPTAVIVLLMGLAHPVKLKKALHVALWALPAIGAAYIYYTYGIKYIASYQELPSLVGVHPRSFLAGLDQLTKNWPFVFNFYLKRSFFLGGIFAVLGIAAWARWTRRASFPWVLWIASFSQFLAITVIDGGNLFYDHYYYLLGLGPVLCLLFVDAFKKAAHPFFQVVLLAGLLVPLLEMSTVELKTLYRKPAEPIWSIDQQARDLRTRNPDFPWGKGQPFRANPEAFPMLGLYFGEIQGSLRAHYGFFYKEEGMPAGCELVDQTTLLALGKCR